MGAVEPGDADHIRLDHVVRAKAVALGRHAWIDALPELVGSLAVDWGLVLGAPLAGGTESYVCAATRSDGSAGVLKVLLPQDDDADLHEIAVLLAANGAGCAPVWEADVARRALLLRRLGPPLAEVVPSGRRRMDVMVRCVARVWRSTTSAGDLAARLPDGATKGLGLASYIERTWTELGRPCHEAAVEHAIACALRRAAAHDPARARIVHADVHPWNVLRDGLGWALVDPDGLFAEPEYDLGVLLREGAADVTAGDARESARRLAGRTGADAVSVWEWAAAERMSTGLLATSIGLQPAGRDMLRAAELVASG